MVRFCINNKKKEPFTNTYTQKLGTTFSIPPPRGMKSFKGEQESGRLRLYRKYWANHPYTAHGTQSQGAPMSHKKPSESLPASTTPLPCMRQGWSCLLLCCSKLLRCLVSCAALASREPSRRAQRGCFGESGCSASRSPSARPRAPAPASCPPQHEIIKEATRVPAWRPRRNVYSHDDRPAPTGRGQGAGAFLRAQGRDMGGHGYWNQ